MPAVAYTAPLTFGGRSGTATLADNGTLTFTPNAGPPLDLHRAASAFNVDSGNNLWMLASTGRLWVLPSGGGWALRDTGVGAFSLSTSGVVEEARLNGELRRFSNGSSGPTLLATGVTKADVDASGNAQPANLVTRQPLPSSLSGRPAHQRGVLGERSNDLRGGRRRRGSFARRMYDGPVNPDGTGFEHAVDAAHNAAAGRPTGSEQDEAHQASQDCDHRDREQPVLRAGEDRI